MRSGNLLGTVSAARVSLRKSAKSPAGIEDDPMSDLHVVAVISAKPGSEDIVRDALASLIEPTRGEDGNISYTLSESEAAPGTFITEEVWRSHEDLGAHMTTPHIQAALGIAGEHLAAPPAIHPLSPIES
jgi:quinol monooxygenase YgiN